MLHMGQPGLGAKAMAGALVLRGAEGDGESKEDTGREGGEGGGRLEDLAAFGRREGGGDDGSEPGEWMDGTDTLTDTHLASAPDWP